MQTKFMAGIVVQCYAPPHESALLTGGHLYKQAEISDCVIYAVTHKFQ